MSKKHKKRQSNKFSLLLRLFVHLLLCLLYKQLVNSSTCSLVNLPCYFVFFTSNLLTRPLVHSSTYHVTLSSLQVTRLLINLFTRELTMQATCLLVNLFTRQLLYHSLHEHLLAIADNNTLMALANSLACEVVSSS